MTAHELFTVSKRLQAIAQTGRTYCKDPYDLERYGEIESVAFSLMEQATDTPLERIAGAFAAESGYPTPKMDVRASIIVDGKILLVRETADGLWAMPGGWADVDLSVREMVKKESREETGLTVVPQAIIAVLERNRYNPPPMHYGCIKIFVECTPADVDEARKAPAQFVPTFETHEIGFFPEDGLPPLSQTRVTAFQIGLCFLAHRSPEWRTWFD